MMTFVTSTRKGFPLAGLLHICAIGRIPGQKDLPIESHPDYGYCAPAKSGAGIGLPVIRMAIHDAPSVFFCVVNTVHPFFSVAGIIRAACKIMVGCAGASSEAPVSIRAGKTNSAQSTTSKIGLFGGGFIPNRMETATWLLSQPRHNRQKSFFPTFALFLKKPKLASTRLFWLYTGNAVKCSTALSWHWKPLALSTWRQIMTKYLFLAVVRANVQDKPHREEVIATSEREARKYLAGRYVLLFAGRLPVQEVSV
ncbi:host cell division inhibitor Icd-like protein [Salmonella enterica]|nr:host cell division inhibitor Icd-like protein [Salmonella enterica]EJQ7458099.1 host cell division inhibitor Icd-like protein [Salmonella enterica]EJQ7460771.1 host cell division inhibitor Icd-like protein [Salmonella enterica]ELY8287198.1 host cell division inhibitor Icd-like protein [Salmonella enterica]